MLNVVFKVTEILKCCQYLGAGPPDLDSSSFSYLCPRFNVTSFIISACLIKICPRSLPTPQQKLVQFFSTLQIVWKPATKIYMMVEIYLLICSSCMKELRFVTENTLNMTHFHMAKLLQTTFFCLKQVVNITAAIPSPYTAIDV